MPLQSLQSKIIKAVPEIIRDDYNILQSGGYSMNKQWIKPITLEDVLRALPKEVNYTFSAYKEFILTIGNGILFIDTNFNNGEKETTGQWHLGLPLDQQSEECIEFLDKIIK
jgi:hypothetical protein